MNNISEHITFEEATQSATAKKMNIANIPNVEELACMVTVANECFEKIRAWYSKPIRINSFFRCVELNKLVGGARNSQHVKGEAIDIDAGSLSENRKIFDWCKKNLVFDQLIWEYGGEWIHISFKKGMNRNQVFSIG
jgi:hypothetical protein